MISSFETHERMLLTIGQGYAEDYPVYHSCSTYSIARLEVYSIGKTLMLATVVLRLHAELRAFSFFCDQSRIRKDSTVVLLHRNSSSSLAMLPPSSSFTQPEPQGDSIHKR
jgi:hypothetical protein